MLNQTKMLMKMRKLQKELAKQTIEVEAGDGAVKITINGEQKIKKITLDPEALSPENAAKLEKWLETAVKEAIAQSQKVAAEKMKPMMGQLGNLGL